MKGLRMNLQKTVLLLTIPLFWLPRCTDKSPLISLNESIVVEAYLYAGEPVDDIKLMGTLPLDADSADVPPPINTATVRLIKNGTSYELQLAPGDSGYYHYTGDDLSVETGDRFRLEIEYMDLLVSAETTVPEAPQNVQLSGTTLKVPDFTDFEGMREWFESGEENRDLVLTWDNDSAQFFYVTLQNLDEDPEPVESGFNERFRGFITPPINDDRYAVRAMTFTHLGHYQIDVYRVNQEYVDLYESRNQDSRDLNEPLTNISNGLGVFTTFNFVSSEFTVTQ